MGGKITNLEDTVLQPRLVKFRDGSPAAKDMKYRGYVRHELEEIYFLMRDSPTIEYSLADVIAMQQIGTGAGDIHYGEQRSGGDYYFGHVAGVAKEILEAHIQFYQNLPLSLQAEAEKYFADLKFMRSLKNSSMFSGALGLTHDTVERVNKNEGIPIEESADKVFGILSEYRPNDPNYPMLRSAVIAETPRPGHYCQDIDAMLSLEKDLRGQVFVSKIPDRNHNSGLNDEFGLENRLDNLSKNLYILSRVKEGIIVPEMNPGFSAVWKRKLHMYNERPQWFFPLLNVFKNLADRSTEEAHEIQDALRAELKRFTKNYSMDDAQLLKQVKRNGPRLFTSDSFGNVYSMLDRRTDEKFLEFGPSKIDPKLTDVGYVRNLLIEKDNNPSHWEKAFEGTIYRRIAQLGSRKFAAKPEHVSDIPHLVQIYSDAEHYARTFSLIGDVSSPHFVKNFDWKKAVSHPK